MKCQFSRFRIATKIKAKTRFVLLSFGVSVILSVYILEHEISPYIEEFPLHPPTCIPQSHNEFLTERPKLGLQHHTNDDLVWELWYCCNKKRNTKSTQKTICGRFGCCPINCYSNFAETALDIDANNNNAFFVETSGSSSLNYRQACSIESLAKHNPGLTVYVLFTGERIDHQNLSPLALLLENYENIRFKSLYPLGEYFTKTPFEHWYFCSGWNYGPYSISHLSDALRFLILFQFGGYYFDSDIVFIRELPGYFKNSVVFQNDYQIAAGTIHIEKKHPFVEIAVEEFTTKYSAVEWNKNGPEVVMRAMARLCKNETLVKVNETCQGVTMLAREAFYPIPWQKHYIYFDELVHMPDLSTEFGGKIIGAHVWNKYSVESPARKELHERQLYTNLASLHCPNVYRLAPNEF